jgi:hypothetical protein
MTIFRVHINQIEGGDDARRKQILDYCIHNHVIGIGWANIITRDASKIKETAEKVLGVGKANSPLKSINTISKIEKDDLIWTRLAGEYYLFRADGKKLWKDTPPEPSGDLGHYVSAEYVKVGTADKVPGKVVNSFRASLTAQCVNDVEEISKRIWNEVSGSNHYQGIKVIKNDFWNMISAEDTENIVMLYLQSLGYYIFKATWKRDTPKYECVLVHSEDFHLAYVQVKSGNEKLNPQNYKEYLEENSSLFYLFSANDLPSNDARIVNLNRKDLLKFALNNKKLLPESIRYWMSDF